MCDQCGCSATPGVVHVKNNHGVVSSKPAEVHSVEVLAGLLHENDHAAAHTIANIWTATAFWRST